MANRSADDFPMAYLGRITTKRNPPSVDVQRWLEVITQHPNLSLLPPREGLNPFTKQPYLYPAPAENAQVILDGVQIGSMTWAEDGSRQIAVDGDAATLVKIAMQVAEELGCIFEPR
jgi:hypothetical protein